MSPKIPDALKADLPQTNLGKIIAALPIIMTVIATLLAGLSSSEMVKAQYDRSLAAQIQSKAGDQWNYFQAKRLRAALQRNTLDILRSQATVRPLDATTLAARFAGTPAGLLLTSPHGNQIVNALTGGAVSYTGASAKIGNPSIAAAIVMVGEGKSDAEIARALTAIKDAELAAELRNAADEVRLLDADIKPITTSIDSMETELSRGSGTDNHGVDAFSREFAFARISFSAKRYELESRQNQVIAELYELQVRKSNVSAERHHRRSAQFFYGMLVAQMAVIGATLSMARKHGSGLWKAAAVAGVLALAFAIYVYFFV
ncbi:MAG: DUF4337 family protein [Opitutaceae bacterium]